MKQRTENPSDDSRQVICRISGFILNIHKLTPSGHYY